MTSEYGPYEHPCRECDRKDVEIERLQKENTFLKSFLQCQSLRMNGNNSWRFRGGWPMSLLQGPNRDEAVRAGMEAVRKVKEASQVGADEDVRVKEEEVPDDD